MVVASRDRPELLADSLAAVARCERQPDQLVVVDSASTDARVASVAKEAGATVVRCARPGLGRARNAGVAVVGCDLIAFTDDDCLADSKWTTALLEAFADPSAPGFVTGCVRADTVVTRRAWLAVSVTGDEIVPRSLDDPDEARWFGHGANMAWRRDVLAAIGGFDERLGVGSPFRAAEDVDAWWRAAVAGYRGCYTPESVVVHRQWRSRRAALRSYYGYGVGNGAMMVKRRHDRSDGAQHGLMRSLLVDEGALPVTRSLRQGHQMAALAQAAMWFGGVRGALKARRAGM